MVIIAQTQLVTGMIQGGLKNSPFSDVMLTPSLYKIVVCMYVLGLRSGDRVSFECLSLFLYFFLATWKKSAANILDRRVLKVLRICCKSIVNVYHSL